MKDDDFVYHDRAEIDLSGETSMLLPMQVERLGVVAVTRFLEFFAATIRNVNTRAAYAQAVRSFCDWCERHRLKDLRCVEPLHVAAYIEGLTTSHSAPTVKQHLAALRMLCDWLVTGHVLALNPCSSVRGPRYSYARGKTPVLTAEEARRLLDSIPVHTLIGQRDRALIAVMIYTFGRVGAVVSMQVGDYYFEGKRGWLRLHEKGGKLHHLPAHHNLEEYLDHYLECGGLAAEQSLPLFRTFDRRGRLTTRAMSRHDALRMVKRRVRAAGLPHVTCCHTFRATGITAYLEAGGTIEKAQTIAAHTSPRTTKLYDRTDDLVTLDEIEKIGI